MPEPRTLSILNRAAVRRLALDVASEHRRLRPGKARFKIVRQTFLDAIERATRRAIRAYETVIHSQARLTYTQVAAWLDSHDESAITNVNARNMIDDAARLFGKLEHRRKKRGALDLDMPDFVED